MKKRIFILLACALCCVMLTSCSLMDKLGFDTYNYMGESVTTTHPSDGDVARQLCDLVGILISDSPVLDTFNGMNGAIKCYRDEVLTYMLESGYSKYSGNADLISKAENEYQQYHITEVIPAGEFEATMYRVFGGSVKLTHKDGDLFRYLDKVGVYISPVMLSRSELYPEITYIGETERTYRVRFFVASGEGRVSNEYFALVIKRDDGTLYIKKLLAGSDVPNT